MSSDNRTASLDPRESRALLRRQDGFSLIEIMVWLRVLLSIGLLALAGLQTRGLIGGTSSSSARRRPSARPTSSTGCANRAAVDSTTGRAQRTGGGATT